MFSAKVGRNGIISMSHSAEGAVSVFNAQCSSWSQTSCTPCLPLSTSTGIPLAYRILPSVAWSLELEGEGFIDRLQVPRAQFRASATQIFK